MALVFSAAALLLEAVPAAAVTVSATAGTGANVGGVGTRAWSNTGAITADDTNYAVTATLNNAQPISNYLQSGGYGFNVPAGSTIDGIQLEVMRAASGLTVVDNSVRLVKAGAVAGTDRASATVWPTPTGNMTLATYGSSTDLWGTTWTPADINAGNFGAALSARRVANSVTASVDYMRIIVTYTPPPEYAITASAGPGGSIAPSGTTTVTAGGSQTYTITPDVGYHIADVVVDGTSVGAVSSYTFSNVQAPHTISATFEINTYLISTLPGANGTISPLNPSVPHGSNQTFLIIPNVGYHIADVLVDGISQGPVASYTFLNVTSAGHTIAATFEINSYTLSYLAGPGGSISGTTPQTVTHGSDGTPVTAVPDPGYRFVGWSDGVSTATRTDTNVTADLTVTANFALSTYTLSYLAGPGGSISGTTPQTVTHGSDGTPVTAVPDPGYTFVGWSDGVSTATRTDTNVTADITVTANFAINTYTITTTAGPNGTITPIDPTVNHGADQTFSITPDPGYHVASLTVDGASVTPATSYTFTNVTAPHTISATFAINTYTLTYLAGPGGSISGATPQTVSHGGDGTPVTAVPNPGYHFVDWSDGVSAATRTDTNVTADTTVTANFEIDGFTITSSAGPHGSISPLGDTTVPAGGSQTYTITPDAGYRVADVLVDGSSVGALTTYTFNNVTAPHTISVTFAIRTYTLTYTAGTGGSISGTTPQTINHGASGSAVTAVPDSGYRFVKWSDGKTTATRTDTNVTSDLSVTATFAEDTVTPGEAVPPHVAIAEDTDACAMCHRSHTSASAATAMGALETTITPLLVGALTEEQGDVPLCYSCHGVDSLGALTDVQTGFESLSYHRLTPETSEYGPGRKQCSSCHDSHGTEKTSDGKPFPGLLRSRDASDHVIMSDDEYCASCHDQHIKGAWDGMAIWRQTAHVDLTPTASGTGVVCSVCHEPHGSSNTALIRTELNPPSVEETVAVPGNDRWLCYACHPGSLVTYSGGIAYEESTHGSTDATVAIETEWAKSFPAGSAETSRAAGECQVCHAATGRNDGTGKPFPKLQDAVSNSLCFRCHDRGSQIASDIASLYPTTTADVSEVVAAFAAMPSTQQFSLAQVYSRESSATTELPSPRRAIEGTVGPMAAGDIDGDGDAEAIVARPGGPEVTVVRRSALAGLTDTSANLLAEADYLAIGDVLSDTGNLNEVVAATDDVIRVYRWSGSTLTFVPSSATTVSGTVSGLTTGDVRGTTGDEIVVTTNSPDQLYVIDGGSGSLDVNGPFATQALPKGPSVGDLDGDPDGKGEIAVAFAGVDAGPPVGVYGPTGTLLASGGSTGGGARRAQRALIRDFLWGEKADGRTGAEVAYTVADPADGSAGSARVDVLKQTSAGDFASPIDFNLPAYSNPAELAAGDVDGDSHAELLVACAGSTEQPSVPGISVVSATSDGTAIDGGVFHQAAGVEAAGSTPGPAWVAVAEMGDVGLSKHATGAVANTHVSTETASFERHVECADCHNVHEATSTPAPAPLAYGTIKGTWGVSVSNTPSGEITYTQKARITNEYELCLKCHSGWSASSDTRNIAKEIDTRNASVHAIEETATTSDATAGSFESGWANDSVLHCRDCHGTADSSAPKGPHSSAQAPLLTRPYWGVPTGESTQLCFECHRRSVYFTGADDGVPASTSRFYNVSGVGERKLLHSWHVQTQKRECSACHVSHGGTVKALLRADLGYVEAIDGNGGSCNNGCHGGSSRAYAPNP